jgi:cytochrome b-561 domain containing protein 2
MKKMGNHSKTSGEKLEIFINTLNHGLIASIAFYSSWYCIHKGISNTHSIHVILTALGYNLLMAEGFMTMYNANSLTIFATRREKTHIHWIMQFVGAVLSYIGFFIEVIRRWQRGRPLFRPWHGLLG